MLYCVAIKQYDGHFVAKVPDLPNLAIEDAQNMADSIQNARCALIDYVQNADEMPKGKDIDAHLSNPNYFGHIWAIITLDALRFAKQYSVVSLSLPTTLLQKIHNAIGSTDKAQLDTFISHAIADKLDKYNNYEY